MITVIIPVLNEENTIASVVNYAKRCLNVSEVIVVDDKSVDNTVSQAHSAGATVISSTMLGKGASMRDGLMLAKNEILVYLDGDIDPYPAGTVTLLTEPIISGDADFCKATFTRQAGRVTELVAKPLLSILFPEMLIFSQPLSGMIAARKSLLKKVDFQNDYGVDIGLLIDVFKMNAIIKEVEIGEISNKMKPWQELGKMSKEVSQAIISRALRFPENLFTLEEAGSIQVIREQMDFALKKQLREFTKAVIFDMDNTILKGRFIDTCALIYGFRDKLMELRATIDDPVSLTKKIAALLKGLTISQLIAVADSIMMVNDVAEIIAELKRRGYVTGIISDSFDFVTNHIKNKINADFSLANELEFSKSIATGEVKIPSFFFQSEKSICRHKLCKTNAMIEVLDKYGISLSNTIAIGDSLNDLCMIKNAGIGVSFCSANELLRYNSRKIIDIPSFRAILDFAN
jgi:glucosyl-3-phosphoglycerate synthase